jgi:hypothetical protein
MEYQEFFIIKNKGRVKSSNVKGYKYNTEDKTLIIEFNDGSKYLYEFIEYDEFEKISKGDAVCKTEGSNQYGSWFVGKTPSVGAAIWKYLRETGAWYLKLNKDNVMTLKKIDKEKLPVYQITLGEDEDNTGITLISLVDEPAIEVKGYAFANETENYLFKNIKDKQIIVGPAMIPDMKIYRENQDLGPHYVFFTKDMIEKMVEKFNRFGSNRRINLEHTNQMVDAFIVEDWIIEDPIHDKSRKYGFELPVGTYMVKVKVDDEKFWQEEVKEGGKYGFSIQGPMRQELMKMSKEATIDDLSYEDLLEIAQYVEMACPPKGNGLTVKGEPDKRCKEGAKQTSTPKQQKPKEEEKPTAESIMKKVENVVPIKNEYGRDEYIQKFNDEEYKIITEGFIENNPEMKKYWPNGRDVTISRAYVYENSTIEKGVTYSEIAKDSVYETRDGIPLSDKSTYIGMKIMRKDTTEFIFNDKQEHDKFFKKILNK